MKSSAIALMLAAILAGQLALGGRDYPVLLLAPAQVLLGVVAASLLLGELTWLTVIGGAASPLALAWLHGWSTSVGVAALCGCWLAPRLWLARSHQQLMRLAVVSMGAATLAGLVVARFIWAQPLYHFTACVFAGGSLALAAVIIPTDTLVASSLDAAACLLSGKTADALAAAANAHRQGQHLPSRTEGSAAQWRALLRLVDQRLALRSASIPEAETRRTELDEQIVSRAKHLASSPGPTASSTAAGPGSGPVAPEHSPSPGVTGNAAPAKDAAAQTPDPVTAGTPSAHASPAQREPTTPDGGLPPTPVSGTLVDDETPRQSTSPAAAPSAAEPPAASDPTQPT